MVVVIPYNQNVEITHSTIFFATVKGLGPFKYQWQRGEHNLTSEIQSTILISQASVRDQNYYICYVSNNYGDSVVSNKVWLQVTSKYVYI